MMTSEMQDLREALALIIARLDSIDARVAGLPLIGNAIDVLQRDMRMVRAAINDMGRTNITAGEVEAMHDDIDRVQNQQRDIEARVRKLEDREAT